MYRPRLVDSLLILALLSIVVPLVVRAQGAPLRYVVPDPGERGVWPAQRVVLHFDRDMDVATVEAALTLAPPIPGHFTWGWYGGGSQSRRHVELVPHDIMAPGGRYTATLGTGALDASGVPVLDAPYTWSFTVGAPTASPRFGTHLPIQHVARSGAVGLAIQPGYPRLPMRFRLFPISADDLAARYVVLTADATLDRSALDPAGLAAAADWEADVAAETEPAFVDIPADVPPGLYIVEAAHPYLSPAREIVVLSDIAIAAKTGRTGVLAWVADAVAGTAAPGAGLTVYDADGRQTGTWQADADGLVRLDARGEALLLFARAGGHQAVVGLDGWWHVDGTYRARSSPARVPRAPDLVAHVHTDRPIYRPGHIVHWKAVLQRLEDGGPVPLGAGETVTVTIRDAGGNAIAEAPYRADAYGSVYDDLALGDEVGLGQWRIDVAVSSRRVRGSFQVEEYVKPDFEVRVETDAPFYVAPDPTRITIRADYYFGKPVAGGEVTVRVFDNRRWTRNQPLAIRNGSLDAQGVFELDVVLQLRPESDGSLRSQAFTIEAEVLDASRRPVYATAQVPLHPAAIALTARPLRYGLELGEPVDVDVVARGHDGAPLSGRSVEVSARRDYWHGQAAPVERLLRVVTDADGRATAAFSDLEVGWYRIEARASDDEGRTAVARTYAWLWSRLWPWYWSGGLTVEADRETYAAGDVARLLVRSPVTTTALVSLERDEVLAERVVRLVGATTVEIPITADMAPGVTARVALWEPATLSPGAYSASAAEGRMLQAQTRLVVPAHGHRLDVRVRPDRLESGPGEPLRLDIQVRDAAGEPAPAQLSLAVVDKAVLALAADPAGDVFDALWRFRDASVATHDGWLPSAWVVYREYDRSRRYQMDPDTPTVVPTASAPPASPQPGESDEGDAPAEPRREFPDTAHWSAALTTDEHGRASVTLVLPDSLTTWRALARAVDLKGRAGQGAAEVVVSKPVIADPALPRFAVQGDRFALDVVARNYATTEALGATCTLDAPGLVVLDPGDRSLDLPFGETRAARWSVVAADVGTHELTARLHTAAGEDGIALPFEVQPFVVRERFGFSGSVADEAVVETLAIPFDAHPDATELELRLSPSLAAGVLDGLGALVGYPYGCVEQTMSRMLPNAVVSRLLAVLDLQATELGEELPELMSVGLQKLYGFQNGDGSWGWWYGGGNTYMTAYVLHGLTLAKAAGYPVDGQVLERGFARLGVLLGQEPSARVRAYGAFVLAEAGRADAALVLAAFESRAELDAFAMGALALALEAGARSDLSAVALGDLMAMADEGIAEAHWPRSEQTWDHVSWRTMSSETKNTAMAVLALARLAPEHPLGPKAVRWLMERRTGPWWGWSTHDSAWAVLALTDWIVATGELWASFDWRVDLDGVELARGRHDSSGRVAPIEPIRVSGTLLAPGGHTLTLEMSGEGRLYYSGVVRIARYLPEFAPAAAAGSGVAVTRAYMPIEGRAGTDGWQTGDLLNVRLTVTTDQDLHYVIVEDWLPAGLEAVNTALATETNRLPSGQRPWWRWWGYERHEIRDDRVTFFASWLRAGSHTFEYAARAVTPGVFGARPAEAYAMYRPDVWGRSASEELQVAVRKVAARPDLPGDYDRDCRLTGFDAALVAADWGTTALRRDVNRDGRLDAADIATADGRAGLQCGDGVPLPPGAAGDATLLLQAPAETRVGEPFDLVLRLGEAEAVGAWEATLAWPEGALEVVSVSAGPALRDARLLGPVPARGGSEAVRIGGYVPGGVALSPGSVLAAVRLRSRFADLVPIRVASAQVVRPNGGQLRVTADATVVSPDPWMPVGRAWLPVLGLER